MKNTIITMLKVKYKANDIEINIHGADAQTMLENFGMDAVNGKVEQVFEDGKITIYSKDYLPFATNSKPHFGGGIVE